MKRRLASMLLLIGVASGVAACGIRSASAIERTVPAVTESVFRDVYDVPVYRALYDGGGETPLRPGDPLEGAGSSNPKPPLGRD